MGADANVRRCSGSARGDSHVWMTGMLVITAHQSTRLGLAVPRVLVESSPEACEAPNALDTHLAAMEAFEGAEQGIHPDDDEQEMVTARVFHCFFEKLDGSLVSMVESSEILEIRPVRRGEVLRHLRARPRRSSREKGG